MLVERLVLEVHATGSAPENEPPPSRERVVRYASLREYFDEISASVEPCIVVAIDVAEQVPEISSVADSVKTTAISTRMSDDSDVLAAPHCIPMRERAASHKDSRIAHIESMLQTRLKDNCIPTDTRTVEFIVDAMTSREWDVWILMLRGLSCKEIGNELRIGLPTVSKHRARVLKRFRVRDHIELTQWLYGAFANQNMAVASASNVDTDARNQVHGNHAS